MVPSRKKETKMKLSTKVELANEIAKERGGKPVMTMNELWDTLRPLKARSRVEMKKQIARLLFNETDEV